MHAHEQRNPAEGRGRASARPRTAPPTAPLLRTGSPQADMRAWQNRAGNAVATRMLGQEEQSGRPQAVQRMPADNGRPGGPAPAAQELRSVFESDSSDSESDSASASAAAAEQDNVLPYHRDLRALRALIRRAMEAEQNSEKEKKNSGKEKRSSAQNARNWTVTVKIDPGASWTSRDFRNGEVGHVWLSLTSPLGQSTQFGFYPKTMAGATSVPGEILCPDPHGGDKEQKSVSVGLQEVLSGYHAAFARADARYHLGGYNCASFASDVWKAMTGSPLPNGFLISNPASAAESIRSERELRSAFAGQEMTGGLEDLIDMVTSGNIVPPM
ncbi:hypothetical protein OG204_19950 [Streptomyces sp. NBC_01387]|uniref:hypothetical protein n=1 Tax=unclassified Streptomyces TaxID=2593676 RepID=UPI00225B9012|nr:MULTISPECIES: hypothetical protein [unclassified Streptomyces]MCX4549389.1 hypothetical protein [Streptomyces sp. NBC_01500]WSV54934.1 hypothetical protein OG282_15200 [Streptomyces sp. NBC_01014]